MFLSHDGNVQRVQSGSRRRCVRGVRASPRYPHSVSMSTLLTRAIPLAGYGSDHAGLVCAFRFSPGAQGEPVDAQEAVEWLTMMRGDGAFVWLHFNLANNAARRWMQAHLGL